MKNKPVSTRAFWLAAGAWSGCEKQRRDHARRTYQKNNKAA
jgi:hypothetical protein